MNFKVIFASLICALVLLFAPSKAIAAIFFHAPIDAMVNIVEPTDGATVSQTFKVKIKNWMIRNKTCS